MRNPKMFFRLSLGAWLRLVQANGRALRWGHCENVIRMSALGLVTSTLGVVQRGIFSLVVGARTVSTPIFVIGHWRSGTTLLHELLCLDPRHSFANTYECLNPTHFLLTEDQFLKSQFAKSHMQRPMDDVMVSATSPQEDEFALMCQGLPSPYTFMMFPKNREGFVKALNFSSWPAQEQRHWESVFKRFLSGVACRRPGRVVLKSPTHSFRVRELVRIFPKAQFVHIVRNPSHVFDSTRRMWKEMLQLYAWEHIDEQELDEIIINTAVTLEEKLCRDLRDISTERYCRVRYEDLVADPERVIASIYGHFGWGNVDRICSRVGAEMAKRTGYRAMAHMPEALIRSRLAREWGAIYAKYGYDLSC